MGAYRNVLVAVDFGAGHEQVIERARALAKTEGAQVGLIHVVEYLHMDLANELVLPQDVELEEQLVAAAQGKLARLAADTADAIPGGSVGQWVEMGSTKAEILRVAQEQNVDLIIIGSHGRHGLGRLLGSTANAILHGAQCDVLAVRIRSV